MDRSDSDASPTRRRVLTALATGVAGGSSGCLGRVRTIMGWRSSGQTTLQIKTVPADTDPYAPRIARQVAKWFRAAGLDARILPMSEAELRRQVLLSHQFDVFVTQTPDRYWTPDTLYPLLHSVGTTRPGWQNPFGYTDLEADELLETQRRTNGDKRRQAVTDLQRTLAETVPFSVVAFGDAVYAARDDRFAGWKLSGLDPPLGYLALERAVDEGGDPVVGDSPTLRLSTTDGRVTESLNPLAVEFRDYAQVTDLLYDPLGRALDGETVTPWLAEDWSFTAGDQGYTATVRLRPDLTWHDGASLTAADVAFTYRFLADTALGTDGRTVPAPRFQGQTGLVQDVQAVDERTVEFTFVEASEPVVTRALTVPILPAHVWTERTTPARIGGIDLDVGVTEALVTNNVPPVGSGPLAFVSNAPSESLALERFEDHFLHRGAESETAVGSDRYAGLDGGAVFGRLELYVAGSDLSAVELVAEGAVDATASSISARAVPRIGREPSLTLHVHRPGTFYLVGFNARREPLSNPRFRNVLSHLIDQQYLVDAVFEGYATPAASPLAGTEWLPPDLEWDGADPTTPFFGSDGELNAARAREAFRNAGYRYENDELVGR